MQIPIIRALVQRIQSRSRPSPVFASRLVFNEVEGWALEPVGGARDTRYNRYVLFKAERES